MDFLIGLLLVVIGISVCLSGLRLFFVALPLIGFIVGFYAAALAVASILGESFLSGVVAVLAGIVMGAFLALISYVFWYVGALLAAGSTGALVGSGLMNGIGIETGWIVTLVAATVAVLFFVGAFLLALPIYVVIVNTSFLGAGGIVAGLLLLFNQIDRAQLGYGIAWATIEASGFWLFLWGVFFIVGLLSQMKIIRSLTLPEDPWTRARADEHLRQA
jgi:hypothetical protein